MIPLSIKQQKALKKNNKLQAKMKEIQFKYKNDPERMNQATIELYKEENASPFAGCFTAIIQLVLLISVFYLVRSPLTYMKKVDADVINKYTTLLEEENVSYTLNCNEYGYVVSCEISPSHSDIMYEILLDFCSYKGSVSVDDEEDYVRYTFSSGNMNTMKNMIDAIVDDLI